MTRDQINSIFTDLGLEAPNKGAVTALLNAFNQEKIVDILNAKNKVYDEVENKYKDYVNPEDHKKIVDELSAEKGKAALNDRKAKYKAKNLNIDDEDVLALIEGKLKESKDFDKDLDEYVKAHPSFITQTKKEEPKQETKPKTETITVGGASSSSKNTQTLSLGEAVAEHYNK